MKKKTKIKKPGPKTIRGLASEIARREGKKSQAKIGNIREILGILSDLIYEYGEPVTDVARWGDQICGAKGAFIESLWRNGKRRAQ